jgi:integrase
MKSSEEGILAVFPEKKQPEVMADARSVRVSKSSHPHGPKCRNPSNHAGFSNFRRNHLAHSKVHRYSAELRSEAAYRLQREHIVIESKPALRHSYTTLLRQNNNNPKVVQGLLRHASYSITMNVYDEAMSEEKRNAHRGVIQQLNRSVSRSAPKPAIPQVVDKVGVPDGI